MVVGVVSWAANLPSRSVAPDAHRLALERWSWVCGWVSDAGRAVQVSTTYRTAAQKRAN